MKNVTNLTKLEFVSVDFTWDDKAVVESKSLEGMAKIFSFDYTLFLLAMFFFRPRLKYCL